MKLTFLGTGAGEGYPGLWCRCPHCDYARRHGGKNLRANSCAVIDERVLLDVGPACFDNAARFGVDLTGVTSCWSRIRTRIISICRTCSGGERMRRISPFPIGKNSAVADRALRRFRC